VIGLDSLFAGAEIDRLSPRASRDLAPLVRYLGADKESAVVVEGFAIGYDNRKKELEWSSHAAEAVKSHLVGQGVDGRRILVLGRVVDAAQPDRGQPAEDLQERIEVHLFGAASETTPTSPGAANLPYP
jgi:outer membrane protein OmpA-like peptidoglycan-associated protein